MGGSLDGEVLTIEETILEPGKIITVDRDIPSKDGGRIILNKASYRITEAGNKVKAVYVGVPMEGDDEPW